MVRSTLMYFPFLSFSVPVVTRCVIYHCRSDTCDGNWCTRCKDGYYLDKTLSATRHYCHGCPAPCSSCDGSEDCSGCNTGRYGYRCQSYCSGVCKDNICDKDSGYCINGCTDGTCSQCPLRCSQCSSSSLCSSCKNANYWGLKCQYTCSNCASCNKINGCSSCNTGYYPQYNPYIGGIECRQCPNLCTSCTSNTNCSSCTRSTNWGTSCQHTCYNCATCSQSDGCSRCNTGYYRHYDSSLGGGVCKKCPDTCLSCSGDNNCQSCKSGYWGTACEIRCPNNCRECTSNLYCSSCKIGHWGSYCQNSCAGCKSSVCDKLYGCSQGCINGYYPQRQNNENHCKKCMDACQTCLNSSTCSSCLPGYYSNTNSSCIACPSNCLDETICDKRNGSYMCDSQCSENCKTSTGRSCNETYGYCLNGCQVGWFGNQCNEACSKNCKEKICDRNNGSCTSGCIEGYAGSVCMTSRNIPNDGYYCLLLVCYVSTSNILLKQKI